MTPEEQLSFIIAKKGTDELFSFLQSLDNKQRRKLTPHIKKLAKEYNDYKKNAFGQYTRQGSDKQRDLLQYACFVCYNKQDYERSAFSIWMLEHTKLEKVISWYCPDWLSDFVNKQAGNDYIPHYLHYAYIMELADKGYLQPSRTLIAKLLPNLIFQQEKKDTKWYWLYIPERLYHHPLTLTEHIWYLFEEETGIHYSGRYLQFENNETKELNGWIPVFCNLSATCSLDRKRLLRETLQATSKNFNKVLSSWFVDLFIELKPTLEELLQLQIELQTVLNSPHGKTVGMALQCLKKLAAEKTFDAEGFLATAPVVLAGNTKTSTASCLMLLEQLGRKQKVFQPVIAQLCCQVFIQANDELQTRAAKIIAKYSNKKDETVTATLLQYRDGLLQNARSLLSEFLTDEKTVTAATAITDYAESPVTESAVPIPAIESTDDLLFLASQAFDNNESWHIDALPAGLVQLMPQLRGAVLNQLQPALQRAMKIIKDSLRSAQGYYDHMLAVFFIDVCVHLVRQHPEEAAALNKVFEDYTQRDDTETRKWMNIATNSSYISGWSNHYKDPYYLPYQQLLTEALDKIRSGDTLPLLSTPTHQPAWIEPEILVQRIWQYQQQNILVQNMDGQLALSRCRLQHTDEAIRLAKEKLDGEWQRLLLFLLDKEALPEAPFTQPDAWMISSLSKWPKQQYQAFNSLGYYKQEFEKYTGQVSWQPMMEEYEKDVYSYVKGIFKTTKVKDTRKKLLVNKASLLKKEVSSGIKGLWEKLTLKAKEAQPPVILYDNLEIKAEWITCEYNDIRRALFMIPNNPEAFLPAVIRKCMQYPDSTGESDKKMIIATLQTLYEIWDSYGEMAHLILATSMLSADKTAAGIAAEIWLHYAPAGRIKNELIGRIIGSQESKEFAPMKRFTDLVMQRLFRVSAAHNRMLQTVVEHILPELPDTPIKNLKKLLEIYAELLAMNNAIVTDSAIMERLQVWKGNAGLSKVAGKMIQED